MTRSLNSTIDESLSSSAKHSTLYGEDSGSNPDVPTNFEVQMWKFYVYWRHWAFHRVFRLNTSFMYGPQPYVSYRFGPFELRRYLK